MGSSVDPNGRLIYKVKINGRRWRIRLNEAAAMGKDWGRCSLSEPNLLDTVIHEVLHAARPELEETAVDQTATSIARALYQMGWRRKLD
jgi:hypothetical protein